MKVTIPTTKEVDITHIEITLPVSYDEEDIPNNFPLRVGDVWKATVNIDTGEIRDWPTQETPLSMYMKVTNEGVYRLFDKQGNVAGMIDQDYVPHGIVPGEYGDYVKLYIDPNGRILNWPKKPKVDEFFDN